MKLLYKISALLSLPGPNRNISFDYEGIGTAGNNPNGLPVNARVYNGAPPAYTPVTSSHTFTGLTAAVQTVQYKDLAVEKILAQVGLFNAPPSCITSASTFSIGVRRNVGANGLVLSLVHLGTGTPSEVWFSLDGGTTWTKTNALGGGAFSYAVSDALLDSLGFGDNVPDIKFRYGTGGCVIPFGPLFIGDVIFPPLVVTGVVVNVTTNGGNDGSIVLSVSGGTGNYTFSWSDGPTTQNRSALPAGTYTVTVSDVDPSVEPVETSFEVTQPEPPQPKDGTFINFPELNSLKFVVQQVINNCNVLQGLDNVLFCERVLPPNWHRQNYFQKYQTCDSVVSQFESDFSDYLCQLIDYSTREVIAQYTPFLKEDNINSFEDFPITIRNHTGSPGQSRVYFNAGPPPIPLSVGMNFQILNNPDGFDGSYSIVSVNIDSTLGYAYIVINLNYTSPDPTSSATARFFGTTVNFNVYEILSNFGAVPEGKYQVRIEGVNPSGPSGIFGISEPIDLRVYQPGTNLVEYRNNDNFSITWKTGYIGRIRVPSVFEQGIPTSDLSTTRGSNFNPININGKPRRVMLFQTFGLPRYMHEKLALIFTCDFKFINGEGYGNTETYGEVQWLKNSPLGNSAIKVEYLNWIEKYNSDDIGTVGDGFITEIDGGFFKRLEP